MFTIVGMSAVIVTFSRSIMASAPSASKRPRMTWQPPTQVIAKVAHASARWNNGAK